jgi:transposase InsO family protein
MESQKKEILSHVEERVAKGEKVTDVLRLLDINKSTYYRWKKQYSEEAETELNSKQNPPKHAVTPEEYKAIEDMKENFPHLRHRQIQGLLQLNGIFVSPSTVYHHLKLLDKVEAYERRAAPWKEPFYEIYRADLMWGADWTQLRIGGMRWYLITLIDFFSRYLVHFEIVPTVNAGHIKALYREGLRNRNIPLNWDLKPELRMDQGSPNTARVTKEFFRDINADFSFARVKRPTENAITERFYGTIKQEEIYLVGDYQEEITARQEIGKYIDWYNEKRPHQSLWNFTPLMAHEINNKTEMLSMLKALKKKAWTQRAEYWSQQE